MKKEIKLEKRTTEYLTEKIIELTTNSIIKDKEIERFNNIIEKLERFLKDHKAFYYHSDTILYRSDTIIYQEYEYIINYLKELKEGK